MDSIEKLKRASHIARMLVFGVLIFTLAVAFYGYTTEGVWWVSFGDEQLNRLWQQYPQDQLALMLTLAPSVITIFAGIFWLQRLLLELSRGLFYSIKSMICLKWLAWLSLFAVIYQMIWPLLPSMLLNDLQSVDVRIRPLTIMAVLCLPVLVHLFSAAKELVQENNEIV